MFGFLKKTLKKIIKPEKEKKIKKEKKEIKEKKIFVKKISEKELERFKLELIKANVSFEIAEKIVEKLKEVDKGNVKKILENILFDLLKQEKFDFVKFVKDKIKKQGFGIVVFFGFNGSGKTSTIAKLGYLLKKQKINVVFAAADTFRAAAIEQISKHGENLGIKVIKHNYGSDPAAVVFDAKKHIQAVGGIVLADTAGRLHADKNLMEELKKIIRVNKPDYRILVLDSLTGNDILEQIDKFSNIGFDGIILTKIDVNEKGGAIISVKQKTDKPILFLTTGQNYRDLEEFDSKKIIKRLLD